MTSFFAVWIAIVIYLKRSQTIKCFIGEKMARGQIRKYSPELNWRIKGNRIHLINIHLFTVEWSWEIHWWCTETHLWFWTMLPSTILEYTCVILKEEEDDHDTQRDPHLRPSASSICWLITQVSPLDVGTFTELLLFHVGIFNNQYSQQLLDLVSSVSCGLVWFYQHTNCCCGSGTAAL